MKIPRRRTLPLILVPGMLCLAALYIRSGAQTGNEQTQTPPERKDAIDVTPARDKMYEAMVNAQDGKHYEAIPKLEWVINNDPTLLGAWETLGWSYWLTGREKDAEALWQRLVIIAPNEPMGYNLLAQVATRNGELDRAAELYRTSLSLDPGQYETRVSYARVLLWSGKSEETIALLRQLLREDPDRLDVEIDLAWAMYVNEEYEDVIEIWNRINEAIPDHPGYLLARANVLILIGALDEAEEDARHVLEIEPNNVNAINLLAELAARGKRPEEVVQALRRVMELTDDPLVKARVARRIAGYMKITHDQDPKLFTISQCIEAAQEAIQMDNREVEAHLLYGELLVADRQYAAAENVFQQVLDEMNPFNIRALQGILETYFGRSMLKEAEKQLVDNLRIFNAGDPFRHAYWARLHALKGDYTLAFESLDHLEYEGTQGAVFMLLYHGISPSEWSDMLSMRQIREHLMTLRRDGFQFITPNQIPEAFEKGPKPPPRADPRPALNRAVEGIRYAWTGQKDDAIPTLNDFSPAKAVCVTFDDGMRNSFRYGEQIAADMQIPITMFVPIGEIMDRNRYIASFQEIRAFATNGNWEIQSHLWGAGQTVAVDKEGRQVYPLPNLIWLPGKDRLESLREYNVRLRREFRESRRILSRELDIEPGEIRSVAYPIGDIGQESSCNIRAFNVPEAIVNEAEITYRQGFIQSRHGYAMKADNPMLYKRHEPARSHSGRDVLRAAYRQHPVFVARRMRAEMAALNGQLYLADSMIELLKRDGYPEEDLTELRNYVDQHLARLAKVEESIKDVTAAETPLVRLRHPYLGIEGRSTRANVMIDEWHYGAFAGINLNSRLVFEARAGLGGIKQEVSTNYWIEVPTTTKSSSQSTVTVTENGETTTRTEQAVTYTTVNVQSNIVEKTRYKSEEKMIGGALYYTHEGGAYTMLDVRHRSFESDSFENDDIFVFSLEHLWRPTPPIDIAARYSHDVVPSARTIMEYDQVSLLGIWRIQDWWHANARGAFSHYRDRNSYLHASIQNLWRISERQDVWFGLYDSVDTTDKKSDLYWTPYWDQRHYLILRMRRSYPNYYGMVQANLGIQKEKARTEDLDRYNDARVRGEKEGWYPGESPEQDWSSLIGISASLSRTWRDRWILSAEGSVNALRDYTEYNITGSLRYRF